MKRHKKDKDFKNMFGVHRTIMEQNLRLGLRVTFFTLGLILSDLFIHNFPVIIPLKSAF